MQSSQKLIRFLRDLFALVEDEAKQNATFAARLETIAEGFGQRPGKIRQQRKSQVSVATPDVIAALDEKGQEEFTFWLRSFDLPTLKSIVKANGFDPAKASLRWREPDKFVALIVDQTTARRRRGSAFLPGRTTAEGEKQSQ
jgi:hypothetical protein